MLPFILAALWLGIILILFLSSLAIFGAQLESQFGRNNFTEIGAPCHIDCTCEAVNSSEPYKTINIYVHVYY